MRRMMMKLIVTKSPLLILMLVFLPSAPAQIVAPTPTPQPQQGLCTKSDLYVLVSAHADPGDPSKVSVGAIVGNKGPVDYLGGRTFKVTITTNGNTQTFFSGKVTGKIVVGSYRDLGGKTVTGVNKDTVYVATISQISKGCDSNPSNDKSTQVGATFGKP